MCISQWLCRKQNKFNSVRFSAFYINPVQSHWVCSFSSLCPALIFFSFSVSVSLVILSHFQLRPVLSFLLDDHRFSVAPFRPFRKRSSIQLAFICTCIPPSPPFFLPSVQNLQKGRSHCCYIAQSVCHPQPPRKRAFHNFYPTGWWWKRSGGIVVLFQKNRTYPPRNYPMPIIICFNYWNFFHFKYLSKSHSDNTKLFFSKEVILNYSEDEVSSPTPFISLLMKVLHINQLGPVGSQGVQQLTTPLSLELLKWCKSSLGGEKKEKAGGCCKQVKPPPTHPPSPKCVRPLLW